MKLISISSRQVKIFLLSFIPMLLMTILPQLGIDKAFIDNLTSQPLISPIGKIDLLDKIKPKLESKKTTFHLKQSAFSFPEARAAAEFDAASAFGVVDLDSGETLLEKNFSARMPIASLTKLMTAVVALDLSNIDEEFIVSVNASSQVPSKVMLKPGEKISLGDLLKSALISSANDSAAVIKEGIDKKYGGEVFIPSMNEKAKLLGLKNTHFTNPQGFDHPNHYSSVEDLTILSEYALTYPFIANVVNKEIEDLSDTRDERFYLRNWNGLLGVYPGVNGLKIGNTENAGHTTVVTAEREGRKLLVTILGAPGVTERDMWTAELLDLGFETFDLPKINVSEQLLKQKYSSWNF